jgi:hypothetical protein
VLVRFGIPGQDRHLLGSEVVWQDEGKDETCRVCRGYGWRKPDPDPVTLERLRELNLEDQKMAEEVKVKDNEIVKQEVDPLTPEQRTEVNRKLALPIADQPVSMQMLTTLMGTPTVPKRYRESPTGAADMMAAVITGAELGVAPMASIRQLYLINGQASMMAQLMAGLVFRAGHQIRYIVNTEDESVTAEAYRLTPKGTNPDPLEATHVFQGGWTFSKQDAELAGLEEKTTYEQYPYLMYAARATSALCRLYFPEVVSGVGYVPDEIGIDTEPEPLHAEADIIVDDEAVAVLKEVLDAEVIDEDPGLEAQD